MIYFVGRTASNRERLFVFDPSTRHLAALAIDLAGSRYQEFHLSPTRHYLLCIAPRQQLTQCTLIDTRSNDITISTLPQPFPYRLHWCGDDAFLCSNDTAIWSIRRDGTERQPFSFLDPFRLAAVANDARHVVLSTRERSIGDIFVGDLHQQSVTQILSSTQFEQPHEIWHPVCWSPDSRYIACLGSYEMEVWFVNRDGTHPRSFMAVDYHQASAFAWAPDGRAIAAFRGLGGGGPSAMNVGVFVKDIHTGEQRKALTFYRGQGQCVWTADSQGFLYAHPVEWFRETRPLWSRYIETERIRRTTIRYASLDGRNDELLGVDQQFVSIGHLISV